MTSSAMTPANNALRPHQSTARESLARLNASIARLRDQRQKDWLATYRDHWWNEVIGDVDGVMRTMSHGPIHYTFDGHSFMSADSSMAVINNYAATRAMYEGVVALGAKMAGPIDRERIMFDDEGLTVSCILTTIYPGIYLSGHNEPIDPESFYLVRWPNVTMIRFDSEGLMMGEEIMNGAPILVQRVEPSAVDSLIG
jgi:hypothetical protein